ncbi:hypothetical protein [Mesorhizobium sp. B4-1-1]|uniref:hypothetical protein n=1 Tax=Mesorhizobium sp. B4-1-1 TaxID=2589890 RepID=UPI001FEFD6BD|nr:hypothetical protein [Mesorhizobium sp. B4-1-1]
MVLGIRPPDPKTAEAGAGNLLQGTADRIEFHGNDALVTFGFGGKEISALVPARECPRQSAPVRYTSTRKASICSTPRQASRCAGGRAIPGKV